MHHGNVPEDNVCPSVDPEHGGHLRRDCLQAGGRLISQRVVISGPTAQRVGSELAVSWQRVGSVSAADRQQNSAVM